jgi:phage terminase large subunit GpA-like protein
MKLWEKYAEIRGDSLRAGRDIADATAFYLANRAEMDAGARVAWDERFDDNEISALQFAMNIKCNDEETFWAEYQNEPMQDKSLLDGTVSAVEIAEKTNGYKPGEVPLSVNYITMFIDIQQRLLFYTIVGWAEDFTGYVLDYGTYPDQKRNYFTLADAQNNLDVEFPTHGMEGKIYAGLEKLTGQMLPLEWHRTDGTKMKISQCMIDANWGPSTDMIYKFCKQSEFSSVLLPSHGKYVGASSKPFSEYTKKPGDRTGINWRMPIKDKREVRHVVFDTNYWKSFIFSRFATALGDRANLSIFGDKKINHGCFADHLTAEYRIRTTGRGRVVDEWKLRPGGGDNHWLDCVVGCAVGAAMQGTGGNRHGPARQEKENRGQSERDCARSICWILKYFQNLLK